MDGVMTMAPFFNLKNLRHEKKDSSYHWCYKRNRNGLRTPFCRWWL